MRQFEIAGRPVGDDHPPYVIAEIGSNHNGDMGLCYELIDAAAECGVDAVKFQSWSSTSLVGESEYARNTSYADKKRHFGTLREMVEAYQFTPEMHEKALERCRERGVAFLSTPFSPEEVDLLERLGVGAHKVASMDVNHPLLLRKIGSTGKPVLLSTGMATLGEVEAAVATLREAGAGEVCLLHCVSIYPPDPRDVHLRNIPMLRTAFDAPVGFSDHTLGVAVPLAAVALGACVIEKHFTIDKDMEGWDHWISADPEEMRRLVEEARLVHQTLGGSVRTVSEAEMEKRKRFRRRIVVRRALPEGHVLTLDDIDFKRPGTGIHPNEYERVVGKRLTRAVERDHELEWSDLA